MFLTKTMRNIHNKTTQYKHRNLNLAHWKVCQGSQIFWTNLGLFWNEHKTWFFIETRWDSEIFSIWGSFGVETWSWNQRMGPKSDYSTEENLSNMTIEKLDFFFSFFLSEVIKAYMPLDRTSYDMITYVFWRELWRKAQ